MAGVVTGLRQLKTKRGDRMAVFSLEDVAAKVETVVFPEAFSRFGRLLVDEAMLLVRGKYERDDESSRLVAAELTPIDVVRERAVRAVEISLAGRGLARDAMRALAGVLERHPGDRHVSVVLQVGGGSGPCGCARIRRGASSPSDVFVRDVEAVCGAGSVVLK